MNFLAKSLSCFGALLLFVGLGYGVARAATTNDVSYLATTAAGTGDCSTPANACNQLYTAVNNTRDGGVVRCLSPGTTLAATIIVQSITIDCVGVGHTAISLAINAPGKTVRILGLTVDSLQSNGLLVHLLGGADSTVIIEESRIGNSGFGSADRSSSNCVSDTRTGPAKLIIRNTAIYDCNNGVGILAAPQSGTIAIILDGVASWNSKYGLAVAAGGRVAIDHSTFSGNTTAGIEADGGGFISANDTLISNNGTGVQANGSVTLSNSDINSNNVAISGTVQSTGNNRFVANISDGTPTSIVAQH